MAEGPRRPDGSRPDDEAGFGWLYGGRDPHDAAPQPEPTQVLPVQPRPGSTAPRSPQPVPAARPTPPTPAPTPGPPAPPSHAGGGRLGGFGGWWARRLRRPGFYVRTVLLLVLLLVVYTVAVPFLTWRSVDEVAWEPQGDNRPDEQSGTTYLLVGSDSRAGLTAAERKEFATGNPSSELTDTIMLLHTGSGPNLLLSIPRDTLVDMPGYGTSKINSAYSRGGPQLLTRILERETGIRIDAYVEIGLGGVAGVVDAVGGIEVCPRERMVDPLAGLRIKKGCQDVDGRTALAYSRSRKVSALGDLDRVRRQREVVSAIGDKVLSPWSVLNPIRWWRLNHAVPDFFAFGEGLSTIGAGRWALAMSSVEKTCTVPVTDSTANTWDRDRADPLFQAIIGDDTDAVTKAECTPSGIAGAR